MTLRSGRQSVRGDLDRIGYQAMQALPPARQYASPNQAEPKISKILRPTDRKIGIKEVRVSIALCSSPERSHAKASIACAHNLSAGVGAVSTAISPYLNARSGLTHDSHHLASP